LVKHYRVIPESESHSIVELQTLAASQVKVPGFGRILWIERGAEPAEDSQRAFLERVRTQVASASGVDLLETSFEQLKTFLIARLTASSSNGTEPDRKKADGKGTAQVYLVRDKQEP
jgi:hypothetical protein